MTGLHRRTGLAVAPRLVGLLCGLVVMLPACATPPPHHVIEQALEAARDGDREALIACFTPRSRAVLETWWAATDANAPPLGALGATRATVGLERVIPARDMEPERALLEIREGPESMRVVTHRLGGMWRIDIFDTERVTAISANP